MNTLVLAAGAAVLYVVAYRTYGRYLARKIFRIRADAVCPSEELRDDVDFVPTKRGVLFGHHFTSIAGTGPIVGPAIGIIWGWVPALVWILLGSIFMGAVHDFGSLVVSLRAKGRTIGDLSSSLVNRRVRILFLLIIFLELWIVVAIFGLVIALVFGMFPQAVIPVWSEVPIALALGYLVYRKGLPHLSLSIAAVALMYVFVVVGAYVPITLPNLFGLGPVGDWTVLLLAYAYVASTLPVQTLLQPRDYINSHQLFIAVGLLVIGLAVAQPVMAAPAADLDPVGAPPLWPMIFVVIACGAISGFHSLVSSGTSSKQCDKETSALGIGYGSMCLEGMLAVLVLIACGAGLAMGLDVGGETLTGREAFDHQYASWGGMATLGAKVKAFVVGSANMIESIGIPGKVTMTIMGVFVVSFAATTLDTATRLQRYVVAELATAMGRPALAKKHPATLIAVGTAILLAFYKGSGAGAMTLWPLFGSVNQLLAGLALLVITVYLAWRNAPVRFTLVPMVFMLFMTGWALVVQIQGFATGPEKDWPLFGVGVAILLLEVWMVVECALVLRRSLRQTSDPFAEATA